MKYIQYQGSPDVFDKATGKWISATEAAKIPNFRSQVEVSSSVRPGVKTAADFATYNGHDIGWTPQVQNQQPSSGTKTTGTLAGDIAAGYYVPPKTEVITPKEEAPKVDNVSSKATLVQFTNNPNIYDISSGELVFVGNDSSKYPDVQMMDASNIGMSKEADGKIFVNIGGKNIHVPDWTTFEKSGLSRTILEGNQPENWLPDIVTELNTNSNLKSIWNNDPELKQMFDANGNGKGQFAGSTLFQWATKQGWMDSDYATELEAYRPENVVRGTYYQTFGRDPFSVSSFDQGAYHWVNDINTNGITDYKSWSNQLKTDPLGEFAGMTEAEKAAAVTLSTMGEEDLAKYPEFKDFFAKNVDLTKLDADTKAYYTGLLNEYLTDKQTTLNRNTEDFNLAKTYYDTQYTDYLKEKGVKEARTIEDTATLLSNLSEDQESELTAEQRALRSKIKNAVEGYGSSGLIRSSFRGEGETGIRQVGEEEKAQTVEAYQRKTDEANLEKTRTLSDLATEQAKKEVEKNRLIAEEQLKKDRAASDLALEEERKRKELERKRIAEYEETVALKEQNELNKYITGISNPSSGLVK